MPQTASLYQLTPNEDEALRVQLEEALKKGLIQSSSSLYCKPVFFVSKKDGTLQLITNYCAFSCATVKNKYPLPLIHDLFDDLAGAKFFSKIKLKAGYNQVNVQKESIPKTAFQIQYGSFKCHVINIGMTNAPLTFVTLINEAFKSLFVRFLWSTLKELVSTLRQSRAIGAT